MEPLINLKRSTTTSFQMCIICQKVKNDKLFEATEKGLVTIREATNARQKLRDIANRDVIDRITAAMSSNETSPLVWHRTCYACFTDKGKIRRLQLGKADSLCPVGSSLASMSETCSSSVPTLRSSMKPMEWNECMFCQNPFQKQKLAMVSSLNVSQQV